MNFFKYTANFIDAMEGHEWRKRRRNGGRVRERQRTDDEMETRPEDDASVGSPVLINRASHANLLRVLTVHLNLPEYIRVSHSRRKIKVR